MYDDVCMYDDESTLFIVYSIRTI